MTLVKDPRRGDGLGRYRGAAAALVLAAGVTGGLVAPAAAQEPGAPPAEQEQELSLDALVNLPVFTSTKSARSVEQAPSIVTVFGREDIERLGARQLIDLLRHVPGFYEVGSQLERNIAIRGIHASSPYHFVVLLDGLPMNDFLFSSSSPDSFSLEYAERVEIIRGPGSAIYGANALMGVVNIITQPATIVTHLRQTVTAGLDGEFRLDGSLSIPGGERGRGFYLSGSFWRQDGTPFPVGPGEDVLAPSLGQNISDGIQRGENLSVPLTGVSPGVNRYGPSFNLFFKYQHDDGSAVRVLVTHTSLYPQRTARQGLFAPGDVVQTPLNTNEKLVLDYEKKWGKADEIGELTFRPSLLIFNHDTRSQTVAPANYDAATREMTPVVTGWSGRDVRITPGLEYAVDLPDVWAFRHNTLVVGVSGEYDVAAGYQSTQCFVDRDGKFDPSIYGRDAKAGAADLVCLETLMLREGLAVDASGGITENGKSPFFGDGDEFRFGSFLQLTTFLPGDVGFVMGGRVDYNVTYAPQFSPRVALVAPLGHGVYSKVQVSSGFVYPAFLYRTGNSLSDYQGNPDIQPQSIRTVEGLVGLKTDHMRAELSGYYNDVRKFITFDPSLNARTSQFKFSNQGNVKVMGVEGTTLFQLLDGKLLLDLQGTFARPMSGTSDPFLVDGQLGGPSKYPQFIGRAMISASPIRALRLTLDGSFSTAVKQLISREVQFENIPASDGQQTSTYDTSAFDTRELTLNAQAAWSLTDHWKLGVTATNLFDHRYYRPGAVLIPYLAEGRRVTSSLTYGF
jgi:outer membrane receptor protein involved in Fe transport